MADGRRRVVTRLLLRHAIRSTKTARRDSVAARLRAQELGRTYRLGDLTRVNVMHLMREEPDNAAGSGDVHHMWFLKASFPQSLEAATGHARVVHGMPRIAMPEIVLHGAQIRAFIGKIVAA